MHVPLSISFCFSLHLLNANWIPNGFVCWIILWATSNKHFWIKFNADFSFSFARHSAYLSFSLRTLIICHRPLHFTLGNNQNYTGMNIHLVFLLLDKLVRKKFKCFSHGRVCTYMKLSFWIYQDFLLALFRSIYPRTHIQITSTQSGKTQKNV